jgi:hypothetical protein
MRGNMCVQNRSSIALMPDSSTAFNHIVIKSTDRVKLISHATLSSFLLTPMSEYNTSKLSSFLKIVSKSSLGKSIMPTVELFMLFMVHNSK